METLDAIMTRRSIRNYSNKKVTEEQVRKILKAAMFAPSARNQQPWHFIVTSNKDIFSVINKIHPYSLMLKEAQVAILTCADEELEKSKDYWPIDCAAASQNILLAAHDLGLGAVWLGVYPRKERMEGLRELFNLPGNVHPFSIISIGYPASVPDQPDRFLEDRIHFEKW
ncbi:MAG: nitroreductase family protein [bacterium]